MIRFIIFFVLFLILILVCVYYKNKLGSKMYILVVSLIIIVFISAFIYTAFDNTEGKIKQEILIAYKNSKVLDCNGVQVTNKTHNFNNGTSVFIDISTQEKINMFDCKF